MIIEWHVATSKERGGYIGILYMHACIMSCHAWSMASFLLATHDENEWMPRHWATNGWLVGWLAGRWSMVDDGWMNDFILPCLACCALPAYLPAWPALFRTVCCCAHKTIRSRVFIRLVGFVHFFIHFSPSPTRPTLFGCDFHLACNDVCDGCLVACVLCPHKPSSYHITHTYWFCLGIFIYHPRLLACVVCFVLTNHQSINHVDEIMYIYMYYILRIYLPGVRCEKKYWPTHTRALGCDLLVFRSCVRRETNPHHQPKESKSKQSKPAAIDFIGLWQQGYTYIQ